MYFQELACEKSVYRWAYNCFSSFSALGISYPVNANPPFKADDPETADYEHWEVYVGSQYANDKDGVSSTALHLEINYYGEGLPQDR
jgi:hypothetical protein